MGNKSNSQRMREAMKKREGGESNISSSLNTTKSNTNSQRMRKKLMERDIKLDTFESDLNSMSSTIGNIYSGWQDSDTLNKTKTSVEQMYNRINAYKDYANTFGETPAFDVEELASGYQSVLDDWEKLSSTYGYYENADAFNSAMKQTELAQKFSGFTYDDVQAEKGKYAPDSDEYKYLSQYTDYSNLKDYDKALADLEGAGGGTERRRGTASGVTESGRSHSGGSRKADVVDKDALKSDLQEARNVHALDNSFDLYKDVMEADDFEEKSQYISTAYENKLDKFLHGDYADKTYEYINDVDGTRDKIKNQARIYGSDSGNTTPVQEKKGYDKLNDDEIKVYNYIYSTEGKEKALEAGKSGYYARDGKRTWWHKFEGSPYDTVESAHKWIEGYQKEIENIQQNWKIVELECR